jgi:hypothetical protein
VVTFEVKIEILGTGKELLRPEMTADVEVIVAQRENTLRIHQKPSTSGPKALSDMS